MASYDTSKLFKRLKLLDLLGESPSPENNYPVTSVNLCSINNHSLLTGTNLTVDKNFVGLNNVDNVSDINKPVSNSALEMFDTKQDVLVSGENLKYLANVDLTGPGNITLGQLNLDKVNNTSDMEKPISTSVMAALDRKQINLVSGQNIKTLNSTPLLGSGDILLNTATLNLDQVNNTSDMDKPVSIATQTQLNKKQNILYNQQNIKSLCGFNLLGSGDISLANLGLDQVSNVADINKPISVDTQNLLATKQVNLVNQQNIKSIFGNTLLGAGDLSATMLNLDKVDNTSDVNKPISLAALTCFNQKQDALVSGQNIKTLFGTPILGNGDITPQLLNLDQINNTSDVSKPISNSTQLALNTKQNTLISGSNIKTLFGNVIMGSGDITAANMGLDKVDNVRDVDKPISSATQTALNLKQITLVSGQNLKTINNTSLLGAGNFQFDKSALGLDQVNNTSDIDKPVSTATQQALDSKQNNIVSGVSLKTINSNSLLGAGDITIAANTNFTVLSSNPMLSGSFSNATLNLNFSNRSNIYGFYRDPNVSGLYPFGGMAPTALGFYIKDDNTWGLKTNRFGKRMSFVLSVYGSSSNTGTMTWNLIVNGTTVSTVSNYLPVYTYVNTTLIAQKISIPSTIDNSNSTGVPLDKENLIQLSYTGPNFSLWTGYIQIILVDDV